MKNFNFSVIAAVYIFLIFRVFTATKDAQVVAVFAIAASPLIWLALWFQGRGIDFSESRVVTQAPISHFVALVCSALLFFMVLKMRTGTRFGTGMQVFGNYRVGWNIWLGLELLGVCLAMAAAAVTIWSGYRFQNPKSRFSLAVGPRLFFAGLPEIKRLLIYFYFFAFFWSLGTGTAALIFRQYNIPFLIIITARAMTPLMALVVIAILRLRAMAVAAPVALLGVFYLVAANLDAKVAVVFVGVPAAAALIIFCARAAGIAAAAPGDAVVAGPQQPAEVKQDEEIH